MAIASIEEKIKLLETRLGEIGREISPADSKEESPEKKNPSIESLYDDAVSTFHREQFDGKNWLQHMVTRFTWNATTLIRMNPYTSANNESNDPSQQKRMTHFASWVGKESSAITEQKAFLERLNQAANTINEKKRAIADGARSEIEKKLWNDPAVKATGSVAYLMYWRSVLHKTIPRSWSLIISAYVVAMMGLDIHQLLGGSAESWWTWGWAITAVCALACWYNPAPLIYLFNLPFVVISRQLTQMLPSLESLKDELLLFGNFVIHAIYLFGINVRHVTNKFIRVFAPNKFDWWKFLRTALFLLAYRLYQDLPTILVVGIPSVIWSEWIIIALMSMVITGIQTLAEELMCRSPMLGYDKNNGWLQGAMYVFSSWVFCILHRGVYMQLSDGNPARIGIYMGYFFVAGLNLGLVAMLTGCLECAWALHFAHNLFNNIFVGPNPTALYHSIMAAASTLYAASPLTIMYFFVLGTGMYLWELSGELVPIITESLVKPIFEVDKIDRTVSLDSQAVVSEPEKHASAFRGDVLDNVVQSISSGNHFNVVKV
jgi:membrane protease YdiL (CAAX protease family)